MTTLDVSLDAAVRHHFEALNRSGLCMPFDEIGDRSRRIVRQQLAGLVEAVVTACVPSDHVVVPIEPTCVLVERSQRFGLYCGTPEFEAYMAMPRPVHERLAERQRAATERALANQKELRDGRT